MVIVYKATCLITGKIYIGWTKLTLTQRWKRHIKCDKENCYFQNCIKKYGAENFILEVLFEFEKESEAKAKEIELIASLQLNIGRFPNGNGMNSTDGGEGTIGYKFTLSHRLKISEQSKGRKHRPETIKKMSLSRLGEKNPMYGRPISKKQRESARNRFRENNPNGKGEKSVNYGKIGYWAGKKKPKELVEKIAKKMRGKKRRPRTSEEKQKMRIAQKEWLSKNKHPSLGAKRSNRSREKMRKSRLAYIEKIKGKL